MFLPDFTAQESSNFNKEGAMTPKQWYFQIANKDNVVTIATCIEFVSKVPVSLVVDLGVVGSD